MKRREFFQKTIGALVAATVTPLITRSVSVGVIPDPDLLHPSARGGYLLPQGFIEELRASSIHELVFEIPSSCSRINDIKWLGHGFGSEVIMGRRRRIAMERKQPSFHEPTVDDDDDDAAEFDSYHEAECSTWIGIDCDCDADSGAG